jgi:hypothetical protein
LLRIEGALLRIAAVRPVTARYSQQKIRFFHHSDFDSHQAGRDKLPPMPRARGRAFRALIGDADLAEFGRRYRVTARVRTLEGIKVRAVARPGDSGGEVVEPNLEEAYLAEIDLADAERG